MTATGIPPERCHLRFVRDVSDGLLNHENASRRTGCGASGVPLHFREAAIFGVAVNLVCAKELEIFGHQFVAIDDAGSDRPGS